MVDISDVRLDGISHEEIMRWVGEGDAESTTHVFEARMKKIVSVLHQSGDNTNRAVQRANAGDWQGSTAESAHQAMVTMRDYDDAMHGHSENNRYSAMGQSGESAATRSRVPAPVGSPGGSGPQLVNATEDPHAQLEAKRSAEQQARQVMAEYRDATQARVSALPTIPPVPKVVLDTGQDGPAPKTGGQSPGGHRAGARVEAGGGSQGGAPSYGSSGGPASTSGSGQPPAVQGTDPSSVGAPPPVGPGGPGSLMPTGNGPGEPGGSWGGGPGGPGTPGWAGGLGGGDGSRGSGSSGGRGGFGDAGRVGGPGGFGRSGGVGGPGEGGRPGGAGETGQRSGRGAGAQPGGRGGAGLAQEAAAGRRGGGAGSGGMMGGGHGAEGEEDGEHINKYGLASDEYFDEDDDYLRDPRNRDFFVAPDVIGGPE